MTTKIKEWLDGGCSSWGVPAQEIASLVEEVERLREALQDVRRRMTNHDAWWIDCPDKGGFDLDMINAALGDDNA